MNIHIAIDGMELGLANFLLDRDAREREHMDTLQNGNIYHAYS